MEIMKTLTDVISSLGPVGSGAVGVLGYMGTSYLNNTKIKADLKSKNRLERSKEMNTLFNQYKSIYVDYIALMTYCSGDIKKIERKYKDDVMKIKSETATKKSDFNTKERLKKLELINISDQIRGQLFLIEKNNKFMILSNKRINKINSKHEELNKMLLKCNNSLNARIRHFKSSGYKNVTDDEERKKLRDESSSDNREFFLSFSEYIGNEWYKAIHNKDF